MKHTPGPWKSDNEIVAWWGGEQPAVRVSYQDTLSMSSPVAMCDPRVGEEEALANAHLIAAAPALLEAAKHVDALMENLWNEVPWAKTFDLDIAALNEAPSELKRAIAQAEEVTA